jgi:hypothetical protein
MFQSVIGFTRNRLLLFAFLIIIFLSANIQAQNGQTIYTDSLQNGWENWSWATVNLNNASPVRIGSASLSVNSGAWQAFYLHHSAFSTSGYTNLSFWIHGGVSGGQRLQVQALVNGTAQTAVVLPSLVPNSWEQTNVSLASLGVASATIDGFWIQDVSGTTQPVYYVDDIALVGGLSPTPTPSGTVNISVDVTLNRHPINLQIYGVAHATTAQLQALNAPLNRSGGNNTSRYNWRQNADNRGNDYYFQSIPFANQAGEVGDSFIQNSKNAGAQPMLTIPMIDWIARVGANREKLASFSISKYGAQTDRDWQWFPDAGNGIWTNWQNVIGNDPNDANVPNSVQFQQGWIQHLVGRWGIAVNSGLRYYILDNEYSLWHSTHRDVKPQGATMDETFAKMRDYAAMIKSVDPTAQVVGPEEWGWDGYRYSGYDLWYAPKNNWTFPDRAAHGNTDYVVWLLQQFRNDDATRGIRLLDFFTLHYYPQGGEFSNDTSSAMQLRRNRSTRALWDPNYTDESWINDKVQLVPRMKNWVAQNYPNTKIGLTEYNWGAENHINGATTQADIYGILGREGMDMATRWTTPDAATPTFKAMQMYRNYDGQNSGFGDIGVSATVPNPDNLSSFAAVRSTDNALTVMVVNKATTGTQVKVNIANFNGSNTSQAWQLTSSNQIVRLADASVVGNAITTTVPAQSVTLFVVRTNSVTPTPMPTVTPTQAPSPSATPTPIPTPTVTPTPASTPIPLNAPSNLTATVTSRNGTLRWQDNSINEAGFIVERAASNRPTVFSTIGQVAANTTVWNVTAKKGSFIYRVRAVRGSEVSAASNTVQMSF